MFYIYIKSKGETMKNNKDILKKLEDQRTKAKIKERRREQDDMRIRLMQRFDERFDHSVDPSNDALVKSDTELIAKQVMYPTMEITDDCGNKERYDNELCHLRLDLN